MDRATLQLHISTPIPQNAIIRQYKAIITIRLNSNFKIILEKDDEDNSLVIGRAETRIRDIGISPQPINNVLNNWARRGRDQSIGIDISPNLTFTIQTFYRDSEDGNLASVYGRGTTCKRCKIEEYNFKIS